MRARAGSCAFIGAAAATLLIRARASCAAPRAVARCRRRRMRVGAPRVRADGALRQPPCRPPASPAARPAPGRSPPSRRTTAWSDFRTPVPATLNGARVLTADEAADLWNKNGARLHRRLSAGAQAAEPAGRHRSGATRPTAASRARTGCPTSATARCRRRSRTTSARGSSACRRASATRRSSSSASRTAGCRGTPPSARVEAGYTQRHVVPRRHRRLAGAWLPARRRRPSCREPADRGWRRARRCAPRVSSSSARGSACAISKARCSIRPGISQASVRFCWRSWKMRAFQLYSCCSGVSLVSVGPSSSVAAMPLLGELLALALELRGARLLRFWNSSTRAITNWRSVLILSSTLANSSVSFWSRSASGSACGKLLDRLLGVLERDAAALEDLGQIADLVVVLQSLRPSIGGPSQTCAAR